VRFLFLFVDMVSDTLAWVVKENAIWLNPSDIENGAKYEI